MPTVQTCGVDIDNKRWGSSGCGHTASETEKTDAGDIGWGNIQQLFHDSESKKLYAKYGSAIIFTSTANVKSVAHIRQYGNLNLLKLNSCLTQKYYCY